MKDDAPNPDPATISSSPAEVAQPAPGNNPVAAFAEINEDRVHKRSVYAKRISYAVYSAMWEAYRDGIRAKAELARRFGFGWPTIQRIVDKGLPRAGWPPLKERLKAWELEQERISRDKALQRDREEQERFQKLRNDHLNLSSGAKLILGQLIRNVGSVAARSTFTRRRRATGPDGKVFWEEYVSASEVVDALRTIAGTLKDIGSNDALWIGTPEERKELMREMLKIGSGGQKGWLQMDDDQIEHVVRTGQLPPGWSDDDLFGKDPKDGQPPPTNGAN